MSTSVLPSLAGLGIDIARTPVWDTDIQQSVSGKETRLAYWTAPRWQWDLTYNVLRTSSAYSQELQTLAGFFNARQGMFDTFLYTDADDNSVTGQAISTGDGSTLTFQLIRTWGSFIEPVLAPNTVSNVYVNGVAQSGANWSISNWGSSTPGVLTFAGGHAPGNGTSITADFTYYWPVRMLADKQAFSMFMSGYYETKKWSFISVKN